MRETTHKLSIATNQMKLYIQEHLLEPITASDVAKSSGYSQYHAARIFKIVCVIKEAIYEPVGIWLPENMRPAGTGIYAHGVEVPENYKGEIPDEFDVIDLKPCKLIVFQGEPYDDEDFQTAVGACMERINDFNPEVYGYEFDDAIAPRMQLSPQGWRGYIEMRPVKSIT